jgi:competence protein ComEC
VLALGTIGLLVGCLLRTPLRLAGAAIFLLACVLALRSVQPDVFVAASGDSFAVRGPDGRLQVIRLGNDAFAIREWLAADGDARGDPRAVAAAVKAREGFACDEAGCVAKLVGGGLAAIGTSPAAFADDCRRAALVLTTRAAPATCAATVIDRTASRQGGALALRRVGAAWEVTAARPHGEMRPWGAGGGGALRINVQQPAATGPRDATPRAEDLGADD